MSDSELRGQQRGGLAHDQYCRGVLTHLKNVTSRVLLELKAKSHHWDFHQGHLVCCPLSVNTAHREGDIKQADDQH